MAWLLVPLTWIFVWWLTGSTLSMESKIWKWWRIFWWNVNSKDDNRHPIIDRTLTLTHSLSNPPSSSYFPFNRRYDSNLHNHPGKGSHLQILWSWIVCIACCLWFLSSTSICDWLIPYFSSLPQQLLANCTVTSTSTILLHLEIHSLLKCMSKWTHAPSNYSSWSSIGLNAGNWMMVRELKHNLAFLNDVQFPKYSLFFF